MSNEYRAAESEYDAITIDQGTFRDAIKKYSQEEQAQLEWLLEYANDTLGGSRRELERAVGYEYVLLKRVFEGHDRSPLTHLMEAISRLRAVTNNKRPLIDTIVTRRITEALDYARDYSAMVTVTGPTGRGKSYTALDWAQRNNPEHTACGRTVYLRTPSGCTPRTLLGQLCKMRGIGSVGRSVGELQQGLMRTLSPRNVLIFDEAGFLLPSGHRTAGAIELVRDIHDICQCGVALILTDVYLRDIKSGANADFFEQFFGRIMYSVNIPDKIFRSEIAEICKVFVPDPDDKFINYAHATASARDGKLRTLFEDLRRAVAFARQGGRKPSITDLKTAVAWRKSGGDWSEA